MTSAILLKGGLFLVGFAVKKYMEFILQHRAEVSLSHEIMAQVLPGFAPTIILWACPACPPLGPFVAEGNVLMRFSANILHLCGSLGIKATLENPHSSRLWLCPPIMNIVRKKVSSQATCDFCMFGTRRRKRTTLLSVHVDISILNNFRCSGCRGICSRTGQTHIALKGKAPSGQFWTKLAEAYPNKFATTVAKCFFNVDVQRVAENFARHL